MIGALIIVFREVIEAGLIIGIVLAATRTVAGSRKWVAFGVLGGIIGSCIVAVFTSSIAAFFDGFGQELFNASILGVAVLMLAWHNIWMAIHGREMAGDLKQKGEEVRQGQRTLAALAIVIGTAVLREGSEVVLFLYGVLVSSGSTVNSVALGASAGLGLGAAMSALTYLGLLKIPTRHIFSVTSWLITFLAAGMAAQSISFLEKAGIVEVLGNTVWDSSWLLSQNSIAGKILHTLIGYSDQPTMLQLLGYIATLIAIITATKFVAPPKRVVA
jgi:high-affinity iron transporter